jgi:hypothetical protein
LSSTIGAHRLLGAIVRNSRSEKGRPWMGRPQVELTRGTTGPSRKMPFVRRIRPIIACYSISPVPASTKAD